MIEKDTIQELFSKAFENQTSAVKPELWAGVQAKMAAAGVASTATVATKGLSALTKWLIGSAAVGTVGVVTTVVALNSTKEQTNTKKEFPKEVSQYVSAPTQEKEHVELQTAKKESTYSSNQIQTPSIKPSEEIHEVNLHSAKEVVEQEHPVQYSVQPDKGEHKKSEERMPLPENVKKLPADYKNSEIKKVAPIDRKENLSQTTPLKHPEDTKEPVFVKLEAKVTKFPTMFTPNGDGNNDLYFVKVENIDDFQLLIIDQNNREMFRSGVPGEQEGWNGRDMGGDEAPSGSYAAIVTGKDQNGKSFRDIQLFELRR